ncbi:undecaprenyl-diphosphatase [Bacillus taeanensis]|uniref:Undecaprenyl-diphosphatase n=1 Tax=Bacillus taeanensis TaxID=273032 RepID=A0A366Y135_9BACI|nr:undecaprenyl-diphosphatase [Bacillus taeanensis]RBW70719.1 undecaprenyl-diphosphatase [Bacillus taeanensis]
MDYKLFKAINRLAGRHNTLDTIMITITYGARFLYIFLTVLMWLRSNTYKKITLYGAISVGAALLLNHLIRLFYFKPRPFVKHRVRYLTPSKKDSSFPSKHTILAFALATSVLLQKRIVGTVMWILALLTGFSRIWVGHHYPVDIIGSAFLGSVISIIIEKSARSFTSFFNWIIYHYYFFCYLIRRKSTNP